MLVYSSALLYVCRDRSTIRDGEPRTTTSTFTQLLSSDQWLVQCCFTSKEAVSTIRDGGGGGGESRTANSTFTQPLNYERMSGNRTSP